MFSGGKIEILPMFLVFFLLILPIFLEFNVIFVADNQ